MNFKSRDYCVFYRLRNNDLVFENKKLLKNFSAIKNPFGKWCADPFPITINNKTYIFSELASNFSRKGNIAICCIDDKKPKWKICFKPKFHISFPNVFFINDELFGVPETFEDKTVALYKINKNNFKWEKERVLFNTAFSVDSIFDKNNLNYLLSYDGFSEASMKILSLRKFKKPNEIIKNISDTDLKLRPAGNIFNYENKLIFPSQNCSKNYGDGIIFNELIVKNDFLIEPIFEIDHFDIKKFLKIKNCVGCHTYNFNDRIEVIDVVISRFTFGSLFRKILYKSTNIFRRKK